MTWIKACGSSSCLEVRAMGGTDVALRSTFFPDELVYASREEWEAFTAAVKAGAFDDIWGPQ